MNRKFICTLSLCLIALAGCREEPKAVPFHEMFLCDDDLDSAVLQQIDKLWLHEKFGVDRIDALARWAETLQDPCIKGAYRKWLARFRDDELRQQRVRANRLRLPQPPPEAKP